MTFSGSSNRSPLPKSAALLNLAKRIAERTAYTLLIRVGSYHGGALQYEWPLPATIAAPVHLIFNGQTTTLFALGYQRRPCCEELQMIKKTILVSTFAVVAAWCCISSLAQRGPATDTRAAAV